VNLFFGGGGSSVIEAGSLPADGPIAADEESLLSGLARRLGWVTGGAAVVSAVGAVAPGWVGLIVLGVWFLPLVCHAAVRQFAVLLAIGVVGLAGFGALSGRLIGFVAVTLAEECVLVLTVALLAGWLVG
jgi:O-antigen ligase